MPRTSASRWFQSPSSILTAAAAAVVAASRCEVWLRSLGVPRDSDGTCHHVPGRGTRGGARREQLMLHQQHQHQQPSIAADRLAFVMQPRSVTSAGNCAGERAFIRALLLLLPLLSPIPAPCCKHSDNVLAGNTLITLTWYLRYGA